MSTLRNVLIRMWLRYTGVAWEGASPDCCDFPRFSFGVCLGSHCTFGRKVSVTTGEIGLVDIKYGSHVNDETSIYAERLITIGHNTKIAPGCMIADTNYHPATPRSDRSPKPVAIGNNVWICSHSIVLPGSAIGNHSVIAAGSVVRGEVPARSIYAGNPGRVVTEFECDEEWIRP